MTLNPRPKLHRLPRGSRLGNLTPIVSSVGIPTYQDVGAVNALSINIAGQASYINDAIYNVIVLNANTGPTTFQINGFAPLPLLTATGDQLNPGQVQPGMVATVETIGGNAFLLNALNSYQVTLFNANGNFTPAVSGNYRVRLKGGGGGGGGGAGVQAATAEIGLGGTGGGEGQDAIFILALVAGTVYPIVIGAGGTAAPTAGGATTFNGVQSAAGGVAGGNIDITIFKASLAFTFSGNGHPGVGPGGGAGGAGVNGQNPGNNGGNGLANSGSGGGGGSGAANNAGTTLNGGGTGGVGGTGFAEISGPL